MSELYILLVWLLCSTKIRPPPTVSVNVSACAL